MDTEQKLETLQRHTETLLQNIKFTLISVYKNDPAVVDRGCGMVCDDIENIYELLTIYKGHPNLTLPAIKRKKALEEVGWEDTKTEYVLSKDNELAVVHRNGSSSVVKGYRFKELKSWN